MTDRSSSTRRIIRQDIKKYDGEVERDGTGGGMDRFGSVVSG